MEFHFLDRENPYKGSDPSEFLGRVGNHLNILASLDINVYPSAIISPDSFQNLDVNNSVSGLKNAVQAIERASGKKFGDIDNPLILKVFLSPSIEIEVQEDVLGVGITEKSIAGFAKKTSEEFAYDCYKKLILSQCQLALPKTVLQPKLQEIKNLSSKEACEVLLNIPKFNPPENAYEQLQSILLLLRKHYYSNPTNKGIPCAIGISAIMYGNYPGDSFVGYFHTRNRISGEASIQGSFSKKSFYITDDASPIEEIGSNYIRELEKLVLKLELYFQTVRTVFFVVEDGKIWIIEEKITEDKSVRASVRVLIDLHRLDKIDTNQLLKGIRTEDLATLLHPAIDNEKTQLKEQAVGEKGSIGSARGKIYFSTKKLLDAYQTAKVKNEDTDFILCMKATYAGDVEAIELGNGVICSEGGYASHAPVVARSLGKPAILGPDLDIQADSVVIGDTLVSEGDYISMEVPSAGKPKVYFGKADLVVTDTTKSGVAKIISIINKKIEYLQNKNEFNFNILANADTAKDTKISMDFGADGIGLCRTEHMFFDSDKINYFRLLLISESAKTRQEVLNHLRDLQKQDFIEILNILDGKPLTVRLLDAPLHEFIPTKKEEIQQVERLLLEFEPDFSGDIVSKFEKLKEVNPMLGHRGCRFGISYPEVYHMQEYAILDAASSFYTTNENRVKVNLKIMFPLISTNEEFLFLKNGRDIEGTVIAGLKGVEREICIKNGFSKLPFSLDVGVMIETPSSTVLSSELAQSAAFFSYGTNDLTQTTHGISRDDINSFYPSYTMYDIFEENPFIVLTDAVKQLILYSVTQGRLTRPDIYTSICGEQAVNKHTIDFCIENNINAVSCSTFSIPIAKLLAVKNFI